MIGPAGMPRDIVLRLNRETQRALTSPEVRERFTTLGVEPVLKQTPEEFAAFMAKDSGRYTSIIKTSGAKGD